MVMGFVSASAKVPQGFPQEVCAWGFRRKTVTAVSLKFFSHAGPAASEASPIRIISEPSTKTTDNKMFASIGGAPMRPGSSTDTKIEYQEYQRQHECLALGAAVT